jgi:Protein of unknown function VcgC/VcgE (DUF2780)
MPDTPNSLSSETGLSSDMVHKGLGAVLNFLREHLGEETFQRIHEAIPGAANFLNRFESSPQTSDGGLLGALSGLAGKLLGGGAGEASKLLESFAKLGFSTEQIEAFLPKALGFIQGHLPAELFQQILARFPRLAELVGTKPE